METGLTKKSTNISPQISIIQLRSCCLNCGFCLTLVAVNVLQLSEVGTFCFLLLRKLPLVCGIFFVLRKWELVYFQQQTASLHTNLLFLISKSMHHWEKNLAEHRYAGLTRY